MAQTAPSTQAPPAGTPAPVAGGAPPAGGAAPAAGAPAGAAPGAQQPQQGGPQQGGPQQGGPQGAAAPGSFANASLYVGELHPDVTEANLFEAFSQIGPVASIRVCRDTITRRSLGYAYVNFHAAADAERAMDALNYQPIRGQPCRIMWSHRDPSIRRSGVGNIFIKNLDKAIDNKALYDTFSAFGQILSCKVETTETGESKGFGYVHYESAEAAEQAIARVNGMLLNEKQVYVGLFQPRRERGAGHEQKFNNVFVKNLDLEVTDEQLRKEFEEFGEVTSCVVMTTENEAGEKVSRGFGFVSFADPDAAKEAVEKKNDTPIGSKKVFVGRAQKKSEREAELRSKFEALKLERQNKYQGSNLYVKNLDESVTDEDLRTHFSPYGTISSARIMRDEKGASRGFGFVCFSSPDEAHKAVTELNGRIISNKPIYVALHQRKEVRRAQLEAQHASRGMMRQRMDPGMAPGGALYPPAQPVFFGSMPPGAQRGQASVVPASGFIYPQQLMGGRAGWRPGPQGQAGRPMYAPMGAAGFAPPGGAPGMRGPRGPGGPPPQGQQQPGMVVAGRQQQRGFKFSSNARNQRDMAPQGPMGGAPGGAPVPMPGGQEALTPSVLAAASPEEQKQMLGERLFPLVQSQNEELAGKITGMLLEMDNSELLILLESPDALDAKVQEAIVVLNAHAQQADGGAVEAAPVAEEQAAA